MAELLIRTHDSPERGRFIGDVVAIQPDGWPWTKRERTEFAVVVIEGRKPEELARLVEAGAADAWRAKRVDCATLKSSISDEATLAAFTDALDRAKETAADKLPRITAELLDAHVVDAEASK